MPDRYTRLFSLPDNLYHDGAPLLIKAGALLRDNVKGGVVAQLKLKSLSEKTIKAITVGIIPLDIAGRQFSDVKTYQYLDINMQRDAEYGQKNAITLSDPNTRSFTAYICEVVFTDNSIYSSSDTAWFPLDLNQTPIAQSLGDNELTIQFRMTYGAQCEYALKREHDLWLCYCGAINHMHEDICHSCGINRVQLDGLDIDVLKAARDERIAEEHRQAEEARRIEVEVTAVAKAKKAHTRKVAIIAASAVLLCSVLVFVIGAIVCNNMYKTAGVFAENGSYDEAIAIYEKLGQYKDSLTQLAATIDAKKNAWKLEEYNYASSLIESGKYGEAITILAELGDYKDSKNMLCEATYNDAVNKYNSGDYSSDVKSQFSSIKDYMDSKAYIENITNHNKYDEAIVLIKSDEEASLKKAYDIFASLGSFMDADQELHKFGYIPSAITVYEGNKIYVKFDKPEFYFNDNNELELVGLKSSDNNLFRGYRFSDNQLVELNGFDVKCDINQEGNGLITIIRNKEGSGLKNIVYVISDGKGKVRRATSTNSHDACVFNNITTHSDHYSQNELVTGMDINFLSPCKIDYEFIYIEYGIEVFQPFIDYCINTFLFW